MANATDNLYVNIIANVKGALEPMKKLAQTIQTVMNLGGVVLIMKQIAQQIGNMEKAYAKLHPETQKAAGSLKDWNDTMARMSANGGDVVSKVLTPIRKALLDIIDPAHQAKLAIQGVTDKISGWTKYTSKETKALNEMNEAKAALAAAKEASKTIANQISEYNRMIAQLGKRPEFGALATGYMNKGYDSSYAQSKATQDIANYDQSLKFLRDTVKQLETDLAGANFALKEIPMWMKENAEKARDADIALTSLYGTMEYGFDVMQDYNAQLQASIDWMDGLRTGTKRAAEETRNLGRAMQEATGATGKGGKRTVSTRPIGRRDGGGGQETPEEIAALAEEWGRYAEVMQIIATSLGEAFATGNYADAIRQMTAALLNFIAKEAIAAALRIITEQGTAGIPMAIGLLALGGVSLIAGSAMGASGGGGGGGHSVELPRMASGGIVTKPTLAMIGEAGPEAVVPLGRGGGGTTIIVQGSIWQTEDLARAVADKMGRW